MLNRFKRFTALVLTVLMFINMLPVSALAEATSSWVGVSNYESSREITSSNGNTIYIGETLTLTGGTGLGHEWSSSNTGVATVKGNNSSATVTGVSAGSATITHSYWLGSSTETFTVTVLDKQITAIFSVAGIETVEKTVSNNQFSASDIPVSDAIRGWSTDGKTLLTNDQIVSEVKAIAHGGTITFTAIPAINAIFMKNDAEAANVTVSMNHTFAASDIPAADETIRGWSTNGQLPALTNSQIVSMVNAAGEDITFTAIPAIHAIFMVDGVETKNVTVNANHAFAANDIPDMSGNAVFLGWSVDGENKIENNEIVSMVNASNTDITFTALLNTCKVTYYNVDKQVITTDSVTRGESVESLPELPAVPTGTVALGWTTDADKAGILDYETSLTVELREVGSSFEVTNDTALYAVYRWNKAAFHDETGRVFFGNYDSASGKIVAPTADTEGFTFNRQGYELAGWNTNGAVEYIASDAVCPEITFVEGGEYYPVLKKKIFNVTFMDGETELAKLPYDYDAVVGDPLITSENGTYYIGAQKTVDEKVYTLLGWTNETVSITEDMTVQAVWSERALERDEALVTFLNENNVIIKTSIVKLGEKVSRPTEEEYSTAGQTSVRWCLPSGEAWNFNNPVTASMTLRVDLQSKYLVQFFVDNMQVDFEEVEPGKTLSAFASAPAKENQEFKHWAEESASNTVAFALATPIYSDIQLYAHYSPVRYVYFETESLPVEPVDYVLEGGNADETAEAALEKTAERIGYTFAGWSFEEGSSVKIENVADISAKLKEGNVTLYAIWTPDIVPVTVTYWKQKTLQERQQIAGDNTLTKDNDECETRFFVVQETATIYATTGSKLYLDGRTVKAREGGWVSTSNVYSQNPSLLTVPADNTGNYAYFELASLEKVKNEIPVAGSGTHLDVFYVRMTHTITFRLDGKATSMTFKGTTYSGNNEYQLTAEFEQDISNLYPYPGHPDLSFAGMGAYDNKPYVHYGWDPKDNSSQWISRRMTMGTAEFAQDYLYLIKITGTTKYFIIYLFESLIDETQHKVKENIKYTANPTYTQYAELNANLGAKTITGFSDNGTETKDKISDLGLSNYNGYNSENGVADKFEALYYERNKAYSVTLNMNDTNAVADKYVYVTGYTPVTSKYTAFYNKSYGSASGGSNGKATSYKLSNVPFEEKLKFVLPDVAPTRNGCEFVGWYLDPECTMPVGTTTMPLHNVTIYAKWKENVCAVNYYLTDPGTEASLYASETVPYKNVTSAEFANPVSNPEYGVFLGWYYRPFESTMAGYQPSFERGETIITENTNVYARWKTDGFKVTYDYNNGTGESYTLDATYALKQRITLAGIGGHTNGDKVFVGWKENGEGNTLGVNSFYTIYNDVTFVAQWVDKEEANKIIYHRNYNAEDTTSLDPIYVVRGSRATISQLPEEFKREGYTFTGWNTQADGKGQAYPVGGVWNSPETEAVLNLYAQWTANAARYNVEFYYQNEAGEYIKDSTMTDVRNSVTDAHVAVTDADKAQTKSGKYVFEDTNKDNVLEGNIPATGTLVLKLYFKLNQGSIKINKTVDDALFNGGDFTFQIKQGETVVRNNVTVTIAKDEKTGSVTETGLLVGDYSVVEINSGDYKVSSENANVTVTGGGTAEVSFTNTQTYTNLTATKVWEDNSNQDGKRPESIQLQLYRDDAAYGDAVTIDNCKDTDKQTYTWNNLPVNKGNASYTYSVKEVNVPNGYSMSQEGNIITNSYTTETTSVTVSKKWEDADNQDGKRPDSVTVNLLADGKVTGKTLILNDDNKWSDTFTGLDKYANGEEIAYGVAETNVPTGYSDAVTGDKTEGFVITNSHTPETTEIKGEKTWTGEDNDTQYRPESITLNLYKGSVANANKVTSVTTSAASDWKYSFGQQPVYENGNKITYIVTEDAVAKYATVVSGYNVTNTLKKYNVSYAYDGTQPTGAPALPASSIEVVDTTVTVAADLNMAGYVFTGWYTKAGASVTVGENDESFTMPEGDVTLYGKFAAATDTKYTVEFYYQNADGETYPEIASDTSVRYGTTGATAKVTDEDKAEKVYFNHKYIYDSAEKNIESATIEADGSMVLKLYFKLNERDITVTKTWMDAGDTSKRPAKDAFTVTLKSGDYTYIATDWTGDGNVWTATITGVRVYDVNGSKLTYDVTETNVSADYAKTGDSDTTITPLDDQSVSLTNTRKATDDLVFTKTWSDAIAPSRRPSKVDFAAMLTLISNDTSVSTANATPTIEEDGDVWTITYTGLPTYDANGGKITYTLTETLTGNTADWYTATKSVATNDAGDNGLVNTLKTFSFTVKKVVEDNSTDSTAGKAASFTIKVDASYADTTTQGKTETKTLPLGNEGSQVLTVPVGAKISVVEAGATAWNVSFQLGDATPTTSFNDQTVANGATITVKNERKIKDLPVEKKWTENELSTAHPTSVNVQLMAGETAQGNKVALNAGNKWKYTFANLPVYTVAGTEITYSVVEDVPSNYEAAYATADDGSIVITNTATVGDLTITKKVTGLPAGIANNDVFTITVTKADDASVKHEFTLKAGDSETLENLQPGTYNVVEADSDSWTHSYTMAADTTASVEAGKSASVTLENKVVDTQNVTVSKTWIDNNNADEKRPAKITVKLDNNENNLHYFVDLNAANNWTATIENVRKYSNGANSAAITYTVSEEGENLNLYTAVFSSKFVAADANSVSLTNVLNEDAVKVDVPVKKQWIDDTTNAQRSDVTIQLTQQIGTAEAENVAGKTLTLTATGEWKGSFTDLPKYAWLDADGKVTTTAANVKEIVEIVYKVTEPTVPTGYTCTGIATDKDGVWVVTNKINEGSRNITIVKEWEAPDYATDNATATFQLQSKLAKDADTAWTPVVVAGQSEVTIERNGNTQTGTWNGLPCNDENGDTISYRVVETTVSDGWTRTNATQVAPATGDATLTFINEINQTTKVTVKKKVTDNSAYQDKLGKAGNFSFQLYYVGANGTKNKVGDTFTLADSESKTFTELAYGKYVVEETFTGSAANAWMISYVPTTAIESGTITVENTRKTTNITVNKAWSDDENFSNLRPTVKFELYKGETKLDEKYLGTGTSVSFENLPVYDLSGNKIDYSVKEAMSDVVADYSATVEPAVGGYTVTNTADSDKQSLNVTKAWDLNGIELEEGSTHTATFGVFYGKDTNDLTQLMYANGNAVEMTTTATSNSVTFSNLPKLAEGYKYYIKETGLSGEVKYKSNGETVTMDAADFFTKSDAVVENGGTITNTAKYGAMQVKKTVKTDVTLASNANMKFEFGVTWVNSEGTVQLTPEATNNASATSDQIVVPLNTVVTVTETKRAGWTVDVASKTVTVEGDETAVPVVEFTNTRKVTANAAAANKTWNDGNNKYGLRPTLKYELRGEVTVGETTKYAKLDGSVAGTKPTLVYTPETGYSVSFGKLPLYTNDDQPIKWVVKEIVGESALKYTAIASEIELNEENSYTAAFTNSITDGDDDDAVSVTVNKVWNLNGVSLESYPTATFQLFYGKSADELTALTMNSNIFTAEVKNGATTASFTKLPVLADGYSYYVKEISLTGGEAYYNGTTNATVEAAKLFDFKENDAKFTAQVVDGEATITNTINDFRAYSITKTVELNGTTWNGAAPSFSFTAPSINANAAAASATVDLTVDMTKLSATSGQIIVSSSNADKVTEDAKTGWTVDAAQKDITFDTTMKIGTVKFTNTRNITSISGVKTWKLNDSTTAPEQIELNISRVAEGETTAVIFNNQKYAIGADGAFTVDSVIVNGTAQKLPTHREDGKAYTYAIDGEVVPDGYEVDRKDNSFTNTQNAKLTIEKAADATADQSVKFDFSVAGGKLIKPTTASAQLGFGGRQEYAVKGEQDYTITETVKAGYYLTGISVNGSDVTEAQTQNGVVNPVYKVNVGAGADVIVTYTNAAQKGSFTVRKTGADGDLPGATFTLYTDAAYTNKYAEETTDAKGQITFSDLPIGTYYLKETAAPAGYVLDAANPPAAVIVVAGNTSNTKDATVTITSADGTVSGSDVSFVNSLDGTASFTLTKTINDANDTYTNGTLSASSKSFKFKITLTNASFNNYSAELNNGTAVSTTNGTLVFNDVELGNGEGQSMNAVISGMPIGTEITVEEAVKATVWDTVYTVGTGDAAPESNKLTIAEAKTYSMTVTNTRKTGTVTVTKKWYDENDVEDGDDKYGLRPTEIYVQLKRDGADFGDRTAVKASDNWTYTWTLPIYDENGKEYEYAVYESAPVANYSASYSTMAETLVNGNLTRDITNKLTLMSARFTKTWVDDNDALGLRPTADAFKAWLTLYRKATNGNDETATWSPVESANGLAVLSVTVDETNANQYNISYSNLPTKDDDYYYEYALVETIPSDSDEYKQSIANGVTVSTGISAAAADGNITNTLSGETISLNVEKRWQDGDDNTLETIPVDALDIGISGGAAEKKEQLTKTANWNKTVSDLEKYDANGAVRQYSVAEYVGDTKITDKATFGGKSYTVSYTLEKATGNSAAYAENGDTWVITNVRNSDTAKTPTKTFDTSVQHNYGDDGLKVDVNDSFTYTITWNNNSNKEQNVKITDVLPSCLTVENVTTDISGVKCDCAGTTCGHITNTKQTYTVSTNTVEWSFVAAPFTSGSVSLKVKLTKLPTTVVNGQLVVKNKAKVELDGNPGEPEIDVPVSDPDFTVTKTVDKTSGYKLGDVATYTVTVKNTGNLTLTDLKVVDTLVGTATMTADTNNTTNWDAQKGTIKSLAPNASITLTYTHTITETNIEAGKVNNTVTVTCDDPTSDATPKDTLTDYDSKEITTVAAGAALTLNKAVNGATTGYALNSTVSYTVKLTNSGNMTVNDVVFTDDHVADYSKVTVTGATGTVLADNKGINVGDMKPGAEISFTYSYTVTEADIWATSVKNTAKAEGSYKDEPVSVTDDATITTVAVSPAIKIEKTIEDEKDFYTEGETVKFQLKVTNTGNVSLKNVTVTDDQFAAADLKLIAGTGYTIGTENDNIATLNEVLKPGASVTLKAEYTVVLADLGNKTLTNKAEVTGTPTVSGKDVTANSTAEFTTDELVSFTVTKLWEDEGYETVRPSKISVALMRNDVFYSALDITPDAQGKWSATFSNLPKHDTAHNEFSYSVVETKIGDKAVVDNKAHGYSVSVNADNAYAATITNKIDPDQLKTLTVTKKWVDGEGNALAYTKDVPAELKLALTNDKAVAIGAKNVTLTKANEGKSNFAQWTYSFTGLPQYDAAGNTLVYTVTETLPTGFKTDSVSSEFTNDKAVLVNVKLDEEKVVPDKERVANAQTDVIVKTSDGKTITMVADGNIVTYTIKWKNNYATSQTITITDVLPTGLTFESADPVCAQSGQTLTWTFTAKPFEDGVITVNTKLDKNKLTGSDPIISNKASMVIGDDPALESEPVETHVLNSNSSVTKVITSKPKNENGYQLGEQISYQITVKNVGNVMIVGANIQDPLTGDFITVGTLDVGEEKSFATKNYTVTEADVTNTKVTNIAYLRGTYDSATQGGRPEQFSRESDPVDAATYEAKGSWAPAGVTKTLTGGELKEGAYKFVVVDAAGKVVSTGSNGTDGKVTFSEIKYDLNSLTDTAKATDYTYTIAEVTPKNAGTYQSAFGETLTFDDAVNYDNASYEVIVTVSDNGDRTLKAEVKAGSTDNITFNNHKKIKAEVSKEWKQTELVNKPDVEITLYRKTASEADWTTVGSKTIEPEKANSVSWTNLDRVNEENGEAYSYKALENVKSSAEYTASATEVILSETETNTYTGTFTNTREQGGDDDKGYSLSVSKTVTNNGAALTDEMKADSFDFIITVPGDVKNGASIQYTVGSATKSATVAEGKFTIEGLRHGETAKVTTKLPTGSYTVVEKASDDNAYAYAPGYAPSSTQALTSGKAIEFAVTNAALSDGFSINKLWQQPNGENAASTPYAGEGKSASFGLYMSDGTAVQQNGKALVAKADANGVVTFNDVPTTDGTGKNATYYVQEIAEETGYYVVNDTKIDVAWNGQKFTVSQQSIENKLAEYGLTIAKNINWNGTADQDVEFKIDFSYRLPGASAATTGYVTAKWDAEADQMSYTTTIGTATTNGNTLTLPYGTEVTVDETPNAAWNKSVTGLDEGKKFASVTSEKTVAVTNTRVLTDLEFTKVWVDNSNEMKARPESITVVAKRETADGYVVVTDELTGDILTEVLTVSTTVNSENYSDLFAGKLPKCAVDGTEYSYIVAEQNGLIAGKDAIANYTSSVNGDTVTNTIAQETVNVAGSKTWNLIEGENAPAVTITLYRDGTAIKTQTINTAAGASSASYSFDALEKYAVGEIAGYTGKYDGHLFTYTVSESVVPGYTGAQNGTAFTNTADETSVKVVKQWLDGDGNKLDEALIPDALDVQLKRNGEVYKTTTLTAANRSEASVWTYSFTGLPTHDDKGAAYAYSVAETEITGFTAEIGTVANGEATLKNTKDSDVPTNPTKTASKPSAIYIEGTTEQAKVGAEISYTIGYTNHLNTAATVTIEDAIPAGTEYVSSTADGAFADGKVTWTLNKVAPFTSGTVVVTVRVTEAALAGAEPNPQIANTATVQLNNDAKVDAKADNIPVYNPVLTIRKEETTAPADGKVYRLGETIGYKIIIKNEGNVTLNDILVSDSRISTEQMTLNAAAGITFTDGKINTMAPGAVVELIYSCVVTEDVLLEEGNFVVNKATAQTKDPSDPDSPLVPEDEVTVEVEEPNGHLSVIKTTTSKPANGESYALGEKITYQIVVKNDGNLTITGITVTDPLTGDEWTIASLAPEGEERFDAEYVVIEADLYNETVENVATAKGTSPDPDKPEVPTEPGKTEDPIDPDKPSYTVVKALANTPANGKMFELGETAKFTITVRNTGNVTLNNIVVKEELAGATFENGETQTTIKTLKPGAEIVLNAQYTIVEADLGKTDLANTLTSGATTPDPEDPKDPQKPEVPVEPDPIVPVPIPVDEAVKIDVEKIWDDVDNAYATRPTTISVELLADGAVYKQTVISADETGKWSHSFEQLPKHKNGEVITYSVNEQAVTGYDTAYEQTEAGFKITNSLKKFTLTVNYWHEAIGGTPAAETFTRTYSYGESYNVASPYLIGYKSSQSMISGVITADAHFDVIYMPVDYRLTVRYVYENGETAHPTYYETLQINHWYLVYPPVLEGYVANITRISGMIVGHDVEYTVIYVPETTIIDDYGVPLNLGSVTMNVGDCFE